MVGALGAAASSQFCAGARRPGSSPNPENADGCPTARVRSATTGTPLVLRRVAECPTPAGTRASLADTTVHTEPGATVTLRGWAIPESKPMAKETSAMAVPGLYT